ncbi:MAG: zinc ribbon domain-containing protein, partial [Acidimicrobiales bacterium]
APESVAPATDSRPKTAAPGGVGGAPVKAPAWLTGDWLVAGVSAALLLGVCLAVALPYGVILAVAASGDAGTIVSGLVTGAFLPFVMFGVETAAARVDGDSFVLIAARYLPLLFLAVPVAATWIALRFALPRVRRDPTALVALVVKIALVVCVVAAVMAGLLSIGDEENFANEGFVADVSAGGAAFYPFLIIVPAGLAFLWRQGVRPWADRVGRVTSNLWVRSAAWGAIAFVAIAAVMGVLALVGDVIVADDGKARITEVVRLPLDGLNEGVAGAVVAMGGAVARLDSHTSLLHWGSYDAPGDGNAPAPLFLLLLLAPTAVAYITFLRLERERPTVEHEVLQVATAVAGGFVVTAWLLSLLGRIARATADPIVQPSPRGAFGLGLVWAALGAAGAAFYWSKQRGVRWTLLQPQPSAVVATAPAPPPPVPPVPPAGPVEMDETVDLTDVVPTDDTVASPRRRTCTGCGAVVSARAAFCPECGAAGPTRTRRA